MPDCCSEKKDQIKDEMIQFVRQKAENFKTMLEPYCKTPEHKQMLSKYDASQVEEVVMQYLSPLYATGTLVIAKDTIVSQLEISDSVIMEKIGRYLECFCECLLT